MCDLTSKDETATHSNKNFIDLMIPYNRIDESDNAPADINVINGA